MCWRLPRAGCLIPVRSGSLDRHAACRLLLWLHCRALRVLPCLGLVAAAMSSLVAALRSSYRACSSHCSSSSCLFLRKLSPAYVLPDPLSDPLFKRCMKATSLVQLYHRKAPPQWHMHYEMHHERGHESQLVSYLSLPPTTCRQGELSGGVMPGPEQQLYLDGLCACSAPVSAEPAWPPA